jgi:hypothetical protein
VRANIDAVLSAVAPGRIVRLRLAAVQRQEFRDRDGRIALDVLRHLLGARSALPGPGDPQPFPLTEGAFQAVAARLGHGNAGIKRCRAMIRRLRAEGILEDAGSYRQAYRNTASPSGYRVGLYRLGFAVAGVVNRVRGTPCLKRPIGEGWPVKRRRMADWWEHALFGTPDGRPPPGVSRRDRRRWRSQDQLDWMRRGGHAPGWA